MADNVSYIKDEDNEYNDWIEIHNPGSSPVVMTDWALTDEVAKLTKWKFPAVTLQPGDFLVVWASGKDKRTPGLPLHTNFSLSKDGELLALVRPDGTTIEQQFAPFPAMSPNESYGLQFTTTNFVTAGASARYLVPPNGTLGTTWTAPGFNANAPTNWSTGPTGLGFGLLVPGISVRNARKASGTITSLADADALLALPPGDPTISEDTTVIAPSVNYLDDGGTGHFTGDQVFPLLGGDQHCIKAVGTLDIPSTGFWSFGVNSSDGARLKVDGNVLFANNSAHGPTDSIAVLSITTAGPHTFELVMWNSTGEGEVEFYATKGLQPTWDATKFKLVGDIANGGLASTALQVGVGSNVVLTNIATAMQNVNSSCYVRLPFTATGPGALTTLQLKMRYNDGFVAYLGNDSTGPSLIAQRNAPGSPVFNSTATAARTTAQTVTVEPVNVTSFIPQLINGNNVLAIHGLNLSAADGTFLVLPELVGGSLNAGAQPVFYDFVKATPGGINGPYSLLGKIEDTNFSVKRGIFSSPFSLVITAPTPGVTIRYTTDRSTPTATTGTVYAGPINISSTTVIRAAAFKTDFTPSNVDTQTYIFPADVVTQSANGSPPAGWPAGPINGQVLDYGMDPDIVNNANPAIGGSTVVQNALKAISSISIVTDQKNLTDPTTGIWVNPRGRGFAWERPCSFEMINPPDALHPNGTSEFNVRCGVRVRGGFSRDPANPKHGFHMFFRNDYGPGKLNYPIFGRYGAADFDQIDLRTAENYSWSYDLNGATNNTFLREEGSRLAQTDLGELGSHVRYVHVYLNGQYFGLYDFDERTEASFAASYLPGGKDDFDVIKCEQDSGYVTGITDGTDVAWRDLWNKSRAHYSNPTNANFFKMQGRAADGVTPTADPVLLDVDNLIDYMLDTFWTGNLDGATSAFLGNDRANNWFGSRNRLGTLGFKFFAHDFEHSFFSVDEDRTGPFGNPTSGNWNSFTYSNPMFLDQDLRPNLEYRMKWADRVQKHMFNGGQFSPSKWTARINKLAGIVNSVIVAESARWGDSKAATPFTRLTWTAARDYILNNYLPVRGGKVLAQLRIDGLYPSIDAPTVAPFGGYVAAGTQVIMTPPATTTLYYMADGSDPRLIGGGIKVGAQSSSPFTLTGNGAKNLKIRAYKSSTSTWSGLVDATYLLDTDAATSANLAITEIMYHPADPTPAEISAGFTDADDFEFVELMNISNRTIDLDGLYFYGGIDFDFAKSLIPRTLPAGARFLLVSNKDAFEFRYGTGKPVAGEFGGQLDNIGEQIALYNSADGVIRDLTYGTTGAWPPEADGAGYSLVRINPDGSTANDSNPAFWQHSTSIGGSPGTSDTLSYAAWKTANNVSSDTADGDGDGLSNAQEYTLGGSLTAIDTARLPHVGTGEFSVGGVPNTYATLTFTRRVGITDATYEVQTNSSLDSLNWTSNGVLVSSTANADGTETCVYRAPTPYTSGTPPFFLRLKSQITP
jgi:hypothetical protein